MVTLADIIYLALRLFTSGLCFWAAWLSLRQVRRYARKPRQRTRALGGAATVGLYGLLQIAAGLYQVTVHRGTPAAFIDWVWTIADLVVPAFYLMALSAFTAEFEVEQQLTAAAEHDPLTGLLNRTGFAALCLLTAEAFREGRPVSVAMFDIDRFKAVNDGWGHAAGDLVLRGLATAVVGQTRAGDAFCRWGGEEFLLLLPGATPEDAFPRIELLRAAIADQVAHPGGQGYRVTVSVGIAPVMASDQPAFELATKLADAALYVAKETGRNRAVIAPVSTPDQG